VKRVKVIVILFLCLALAGTTACMPGGGDGEEESNWQLAEVVRGDLSITVNGSGFIETPEEVVLTFERGGKVGKTFVEMGDEVYQGEPLVSLYPVNEQLLELAVTQAEASLLQAEYDLDQVINPYTDDEIANAEQEVEDAEDWLELTEDMLRYAIKHGDEWEVMQWQMEVFKAENQLTAAEDKLEEMQEEPDEDLVEMLEKQVLAAEQALEEAKSELEIEIMNAPFSGAVASINVEEGDIIPSPGASAIPVVRLLDTSTMLLVVELDEIDIPSVETGQRAIITIDALPALELEGTVTSVSAVPTVEAGLVLYDARISFDVPQGAKIKVGMSATADAISTQRTDVLLVPDRAINYGQDGPVVRVMVDKEIEERLVVVGISDGFQTEIKEGLEEGETVVVRGSTESDTDQGFGLFG
jgi:RND family efflux transporter MFP subunit